jgi:hypothetical protein
MKIIKLERQKEHDRDYYIFECPGCGCAHMISVPGWTFNGDFEKPTIRASVLVNGGGENPSTPRCHSFVTDGMIEFLSDCTHELKGQTVPLCDI